LEAGPAVIAGLLAALGGSRLIRTALRFGLAVAAVLLLLLACRRLGEQLGRLLEPRESLERSNAVQREMLDAAVRPRDRDELAKRLRDGRF
jgi:response regulator of citrate/malate metabolism